jgi:hypothetical protein
MVRKIKFDKRKITTLTPTTTPVHSKQPWQSRTITNVWIQIPQINKEQHNTS